MRFLDLTTPCRCQASRKSPNSNPQGGPAGRNMIALRASTMIPDKSTAGRRYPWSPPDSRSACALESAQAKGFSLIEVVVSIGILAIGLAATAWLVAATITGTARARYMSQAATLASEKLEDLNRWPSNDLHVYAPVGGAAGSLTADVVQSVTSGGISADVNYYDEISISASGGAISEVITALDDSGNTIYKTTVHQPDGTIVSTTSTAAAPPGAISNVYKRRWLIEADQPVAGVRRVTVLITLTDLSVRPPVSFQMSMVRP